MIKTSCIQVTRSHNTPNFSTITNRLYVHDKNIMYPSYPIPQHPKLFFLQLLIGYMFMIKTSCIQVTRSHNTPNFSTITNRLYVHDKNIMYPSYPIPQHPKLFYNY